MVTAASVTSAQSAIPQSRGMAFPIVPADGLDSSGESIRLGTQYPSRRRNYAPSRPRWTISIPNGLEERGFVSQRTVEVEIAAALGLRIARRSVWPPVSGARWCCENAKPGSPGNRSPGPKQWPRQAARTRTGQCGPGPRTRVWRPRAGRAQHPATPRHKRRISRSTSPNRPRSYDNLCRKTRRQNNGRNFQCSTGNGSFVLS